MYIQGLQSLRSKKTQPTQRESSMEHTEKTYIRKHACLSGVCRKPLASSPMSHQHIDSCHWCQLILHSDHGRCCIYWTTQTLLIQIKTKKTKKRACQLYIKYYSVLRALKYGEERASKHSMCLFYARTLTPYRIHSILQFHFNTLNSFKPFFFYAIDPELPLEPISGQKAVRLFWIHNSGHT